MEEHQEHNLPLPPIDSLYILPTPTTHANLETLTTKAQFALSALQNFKKLVPLYKLLPLYQKHWQPLKLHGIVDGSDMEHLDLGISTSSTSSSSLQRLEELVLGGGGGGSVSPTFCFHFILFYFILF